MNCPRCGETMYGSVCPRCGNVVMSDRQPTRRVTPRTAPRMTSRASNRNDITFMDNNRGRAIRPKKKKPALNINIYTIVIVVLVVICLILFLQNRSANAKLTEAQNTINTQNETIKAKDQQIADLNTAASSTDSSTPASDGGESTDSSENSTESAPVVEFDENGNVLSIDENGSTSDSSDSADKEYKSGDTYTVVDGDTGSTICNKVYGEYTQELWEKLLSANGMTTSSSYHPGDELKIP